MKRERRNPEFRNNDPGKWFGPFYFNKEDSRIIVPKLNPSLGGTFNMASPYSILIIIVILGVIITTALFRF
jgi:uncharacterized membrane protein